MRVQMRTQMFYRSDFLLALVGLFLQIYLLKVVWSAVFPRSGHADGAGGRDLTMSAQITYVTLSSIQYWLFNPWDLSRIPERVRDGKVAGDLSRPVAFTGQMLAAQAGVTCAMLPFALVALPFAVVVGGTAPPASNAAALAYAASLLPAYLVTLLLSAAVSMTAFWTMEVSGIFMIYRMVAQFFAGALVPLWFMPGWMAGAAQVLPFQATIYTPVALYLGQIDGAAEVARAIGTQWAWAVAAWLGLRTVWRRALRRVVVQGG
ncbi:ABC transporter permease [Streptomyces sp. NPDC102381]|uniref:ABC transporter permease n=1 Tax=Streptomyces sp. NPDC102381 TaxID=3366164 RepID=UPI0038265C01